MESGARFDFTDGDRRLLERLQPFLPDRIFDAHAHIYRREFLPENGGLFQRLGTTDVRRLREEKRRIYGDRAFGALLLPMPSPLFKTVPGLRDEANAYIASQLDGAPGFYGTAYVMPGDSREQVEAMLVHPHIRGFKCYHQTADCTGPTFHAEIREYLPESAWEAADAHGLTITLHMVKDKSLADPENLACIRTMTARYPNAKLILAHAARGFASWTAVETVRQLRGADNIYYDLAAVCDPAAIFEIIRQAGAERVMWGTDYPIDCVRGKPVSCGETFTWIYPGDLPCPIDFPVSLTVLESLFAFYQASLMLDLGRPELERIFWKNAADLFGPGPV